MMYSRAVVAFLLLASPALATLTLKSSHAEQACAAEDLQHRAELQNKLAGACEDVCKEMKKYPDCDCPDFVKPDETPGVMTWEELNTHMDNLVEWGEGELKS